MNISVSKRLFLTLAIALFLCGAVSAGAKDGQSAKESSNSEKAGGSQNAGAPDKAEKRAGEQIKWQVIGNGATDGSSASYSLKGTVGQAAVGGGSSASYNLEQGFWQNFAAAGSCNCGDADGSGAISIGDAVFIINYIFGGGPSPSPACLGDADGSGSISIGDAVYIINFIFGGGPAPGGC